MSEHETRLRDELTQLASVGRGRQLLQLALRGIQQGEQELVAGCWVRGGIAGCLFQHSYWQGVREGRFPAARGAGNDWVSAYAGRDLYWNVIRTIAAFDELAKREFLERDVRILPLRRGGLQRAAWRRRVETLLVSALAAEAPSRHVRTRFPCADRPAGGSRSPTPRKGRQTTLPAQGWTSGRG